MRALASENVNKNFMLEFFMDCYVLWGIHFLCLPWLEVWGHRPKDCNKGIYSKKGHSVAVQIKKLLPQIYLPTLLSGIYIPWNVLAANNGASCSTKNWKFSMRLPNNMESRSEVQITIYSKQNCSS